MLPPLDAIGLEPSDVPHYSMSRGGSGLGGRTDIMPIPSARTASTGLGIGDFKPGVPNPFSMGNFATLGRGGAGGKSSEERFAMANRAVSVGSQAGMSFIRPTPMAPLPRQGSPGGRPMGSSHTRSRRGEKMNEGSKVPSHQQLHGSGFNQSQIGPSGIPLEPVAPLEMSANLWTVGSISRKPQTIDTDSPEIVDREVKALLNKLTMEKFDSISDQIIAWANKSEKEKDGRTLIQVIRLTFEKATNEAVWSEMCSRLLRKMMNQISSKVQVDDIKNSEGMPIAGGQLFRKCLLNRCQEDFERGWGAKDATAAAVVAKASEDEAAKAANDQSGDIGEPVLYSDEYYAAQKAKRRGLGLIKLMGELFKLQMLTERIMHECIKKLLFNVENPEEEEIESLCKLLSTVGKSLDTSKARAHMNVYFSRMKKLTRSGNVSSRMQSMLQVYIFVLSSLHFG
jgi:translation initiation factor 4G